MTLHDVCAGLLPRHKDLQLETMATAEQGLTLAVAITAPQATGPDCAQPSSHVHSGYQRTLTDLPWATTPVRLHLRVRRFFCEAPHCGRRTFTERFPHVAPPYARTTARLRETQTQTGLALGGAAGARYLARQGMPGSRNTLLRRVRCLPVPEAPPPRVIGIDDWAQRKGRTYGTIVVDWERGCPVDLLPDRSAETVATWLRGHPEVTVVARDRAEAYAAGVAQGAPEAVQVADRWPLLKNLRDAVEIELTQRPTLPWCPPRTASAETPLDTSADTAPLTPPPIYPETPAGRHAEAARQARRAQRLEPYQQACILRQQGLSMSAVARQVGVSPRTLCRWFAAKTFPERQRRTGDTSCLDPYRASLAQQWEAGCRKAMHLWRDLRRQGFPGSYQVVATSLAPLRRGQPVRPPTAEPAAGSTAPTAPAALTARQLSYLLVRRPSDRTAEEQEHVAQGQQHDPIMAQVTTLTEDFAQMVRERTPDRLKAWLDTVVASAFPDLKRFAHGIRHDAAVHAALALPSSNGPTEGQITRLKLLKRQMYGRAKLDLLRQRVRYAA